MSLDEALTIVRVEVASLRQSIQHLFWLFVISTLIQMIVAALLAAWLAHSFQPAQ